MSNSVDVILFEKSEQIGLGNVSLGACGPDEVICETLYSTISPGTELRMLAGHYGTEGKFPFIPGYSSVGRIVSVGAEAMGWRVGDLVNSRNTLPFDGINTLYGAHASAKKLPASGVDRPVHLPVDADPLDYVLTDVAAISLRGVEAAAPQPGETAVVIGQGLIGALSAAWLVLAGCRVIVVDFEASRLERALANGVAFGVSPGESDAVARIQTICNGGADVVVEASGSAAGVEMALKLLRKKPQNYSSNYMVEPIRFYGGDWPRLVFQANYLQPIPWKPDSAVPGEAAVFITPRDRGIEERQRVIEHIRAGRLKTQAYVEEIFPWKNARQAYEKLGKREIVSAVIDWKGAAHVPAAIIGRVSGSR